MTEDKNRAIREAYEALVQQQTQRILDQCARIRELEQEIERLRRLREGD